MNLAKLKIERGTILAGMVTVSPDQTRVYSKTVPIADKGRLVLGGTTMTATEIDDI